MTITASVAQGAESWPRHILEERLANPILALSVLELHLNSNQWIHHRLHQITFQDDTSVRHTFTVDLTVPERAPTFCILQAQGVRLLPLDLLRKQNLINCEACDQKGRRLSYFTRNQLGVLVGTMLVKYAEGLLNEPLPYSLALCLQGLATRDRADVKTAQEYWEDIVFPERRAQIAKARLQEMVEFTSILKRLISHFILLVPIAAPPGTRLKIRYFLDVPIEPFLEAPPKEGLAQRMGWRCTRIDFPLEAAADTEIYHFEVEDPPGVDLAMAAICEYPEPTGSKLKVHDWQKGGLPKLNLRASGVQQGSIVVAHVDFKSSRQGWLAAFVTCAWVVALLLAIGAWRLDYMLHLGKQTEGTDPIGVAAAVLVFLTGVIAALLARADEHGLTRKILSRLRQLAVLTAVLPGAAVAGLLFVPTGAPLRWVWSGLAVAALVAAMLSTLSYILPRPLKLLNPDKIC